MNLLASADTLPAAGGMSPSLAFIYDLFNNPLFIFVGGLVLLGVFFWYLGSDQDKVKRNAGIGAVSQLCSLLFMHQIGVKLTTVPYKGAGPAMNDLMGGQVDLLCDQTTQTVPVIQDGKRAKVFGVTTPQRLSSLPNVPTLDEQGLKGFDVKVWHGMYAPKGTPKEVMDKLNKALNAAIKDENVKKRIAELSSDLATPEKATPESLQKHLASEVARWGKVIHDAGIVAE